MQKEIGVKIRKKKLMKFLKDNTSIVSKIDGRHQTKDAKSTTNCTVKKYKENHSKAHHTQTPGGKMIKNKFYSNERIKACYIQENI